MWVFLHRTTRWKNVANQSLSHFRHKLELRLNLYLQLLGQQSAHILFSMPKPKSLRSSLRSIKLSSLKLFTLTFLGRKMLFKKLCNFIKYALCTLHLRHLLFITGNLPLQEVKYLHMVWYLYQLHKKVTGNH